jgi:hypothetical protein
MRRRVIKAISEAGSAWALGKAGRGGTWRAHRGLTEVRTAGWVAEARVCSLRANVTHASLRLHCMSGTTCALLSPCGRALCVGLGSRVEPGKVLTARPWRRTSR